MNLKQSKKEYVSNFFYGDKCCHCGGNNHPYMVKDDLWLRIAKNKKNRFICLICFEQKMGRSLHLSDFTQAPINYGCFDFDCRVFVSLRDT
jgi:hypothetical protein